MPFVDSLEMVIRHKVIKWTTLNCTMTSKNTTKLDKNLFLNIMPVTMKKLEICTWTNRANAYHTITTTISRILDITVPISSSSYQGMNEKICKWLFQNQTPFENPKTITSIRVVSISKHTCTPFSIIASYSDHRNNIQIYPVPRNLCPTYLILFVWQV